MKRLVFFLMLFLASTTWAADTDVDTDANGAIDVSFGGTNRTAIAADVLTLLGQANNAGIKSQLSIDDLVTLSGVADGAVNLGTFTGTTINDNQTVKASLQALETAVEGKQASMTAASQAEMEAGTEAALRSMSPLRVAQAIAALAGTGSGTVTSVGDCASGDCLDGTNDGGTYIRLYDGNSHYTQIAAGDSTGNLTFTLPTAVPAGNNYILVMSTTGAISTRADTTYQPLNGYLTDIASLTLAQGDLFYFNGTDIVNLAAGVNGQYLKTQGAGANPTWGDPAGSGDMTAVGNFTSGAAFTEADTTNGILYFEGTTANDFEVAFTARNATADRTIYLPDSDGDVVVGPANGFGTTNRLIKTNGTGSLTQITGITVDGSENVTGILGITPVFISFGDDPSDAGVVRLSNGTYIMSEANPTGTDISLIGTDSSNIVQIGAVGASAGVVITPATTITGNLTLSASILTGNRAFTIGDGTTDSITFTTDGTGNAEIVLPNDAIGDAEVDWGSGAGQIDLDDVPDGTTYQRVLATDVDANGHVNIVQDSDGTGAVQFTGPTATRAITVDDAAQALAARNRVNTFTENNVFGNADSDTLSIQAIVRGVGRAVTIDDDGTSAPTYATATNELFVEGDIEAGGNVYATGFIVVGGTGDSYVEFVNNASGHTPAVGEYSVYFETDTTNKFKISINGSEKEVLNAADAQTISGIKTHTAAIYFGDASNTGSFRVYDGSSNYVAVTAPSLSGDYTLTLPTTDGDSGQYLQTNGSGTLSWAAPSATAHGSDTYVQFNDGGSALGSDNAFTWNKTTNTLTLGADGQDGSIVLFNESGGTDYTLTLQPGTQAANAVITFPAATSTLATTNTAETISATKTFSAAPIPSGATIDLGSTAAEWRNLYLTDGGIIYGQANQGNSLTSAATGWTANLEFSARSFVPTAAANAAGEFGYASNAFSWFANSEDFLATASANLWTFSSGTSATFAFTPAVGFTAATTHSAGIVVADSQTITFDESAADPNDADVVLSATDGVFKIAAANGANNEDLTIDLDQTANTAIIGSSTGLTLITTGSIPLNGAIKVVVKDADYTIGTDNANEAYGAIFFNSAASTRTFTLPSAAAGMNVCIRNLQGVAQVLRLDANTGDYIVKETGARTSASAEYYGSTADAGAQLCVVAYDATDWYVTSIRGTWTEE